MRLAELIAVWEFNPFLPSTDTLMHPSLLNLGEFTKKLIQVEVLLPVLQSLPDRWLAALNRRKQAPGYHCGPLLLML